MEQQKKECILRAATQAFSRFGFKKASVDEIAKEAGVAKGTVYLACDSKEELFYQSVHREVRSWSAEVARHIDPRVPADALLEQVSRVSFTYLEGHPLVRDLLFGFVNGQVLGWGARFDELKALGRGTTEEILRLGLRQGVFRADLDVEETASILQDLQIVAYLDYARGGGDLGRLERRASAAFRLVLDGLRRPAEAAAGRKTKANAA